LNPAWLQLTGHSVESSLGRHVIELIVEDDRRAAVAEFTRLVSGDAENIETEFRFDGQGGTRWVSVRSRVMRSPTGELVGTCGTMHDITSRKASEARTAEISSRISRQNTVLSLASSVARVGYWRLDLDRRTAEISNEASRLLLIPAGVQAMPDDLATGFLEADRETVRAALTKGMSGQEFDFEARLSLPSAGMRHVFCRGVPERNWNGGVEALFGIVKDITEERLNERALNAALARARQASEEDYRLATTDELTGLPNRRHFMTELNRALVGSERSDRLLSLAMFDVDHFKQVNDTHGHDGGDVVLRALCRAANAVLRPSDVIGRLGGEEFGLLLLTNSVEEAKDVCERIRTRIEQTLIQLPSLVCCKATISIGLAVSSGGQDVDSILKQADLALYEAKRKGRNCLRVAA
jgi:diguanylate cyclase (GGDEF)-like protein/PAS domain S-box-containing protein